MNTLKKWVKLVINMNLIFIFLESKQGDQRFWTER